MKIECILATEDNANIIRNLYPLYLYDLSEIYGNVPNQHGIYEDEEDIKTLEEQYHVQDVWFENPKELHPFIIFVDQKPAGFALVSTGKYAPKSTDFYLFEFFLLRPYRGQNIATKAAHQVFDRFSGQWELYTGPSSSNLRAQSFWLKTLTAYTNDDFVSEIGQTFNGEKRIFRFNNTENKIQKS